MNRIDSIETIDDLTRQARQLGLFVRFTETVSGDDLLPDLLLLIESELDSQQLTFASPLQNFEITGLFNADFAGMINAIEDDTILLDTMEVLANAVSD